MTAVRIDALTIAPAEAATLGLFRSVREQLLDSIVGRVARAREDDLRRMLGEWVSELEPTLIIDGQGRMIGLAALGPNGEIATDVLIRARPIEVSIVGNVGLPGAWREDYGRF